MTYLIIISISIILLFLISVFTARTRIVRLYKHYSKIQNSANVSGQNYASYAREKLELDVSFALVKGQMTDAYVSKAKTVLLSREVAYGSSIASLAIISHELGHAMQDKFNEPAYRLRKIFFVINKLLRPLIIPAIIVGGIFKIFALYNPAISNVLLVGAVIAILFEIIFRIVTLPVEFGASKKALQFLKSHDIVTKSEYAKIKKFLRVAGQTYIVGMFD